MSLSVTLTFWKMHFLDVWFGKFRFLDNIERTTGGMATIDIDSKSDSFKSFQYIPEGEKIVDCSFFHCCHPFIIPGY